MKVRKMIYCAMFSALLAVCSQISIPLNPVPINLALLAVLLCGGLLGKKYASVSVIVYILLGAVGVPVFASLKGGLAVLAGPTGGYIAGYVIAAFVTGFFFEKSDKFYVLIPGMVLAVLMCYAFGTLWYIFVTKAKFVTALASCVLPFLPLDFVKIMLSFFAVKCIKRTGVLN